jgi:hypothetical protein
MKRRTARTMLILLVAALTMGGLATLASWPQGQELLAFSGDFIYRIPGDPTAGYPMPIPIPVRLGWIADVVVGPDGLLYVADGGDQSIVRFEPDGSDKTEILGNSFLYPSDLAFDSEGNLFFTTYDRRAQNEGSSMGVWRIAGAEPGAEPEKIIEGTDIQECGVLEENCRFGPPAICVLTTGPHAGDLLLGGRENVAIVRAVGPDYQTLVPFVMESNPPSSVYAADEAKIPPVLIDFWQLTTSGNILATDFINGQILEFDSEGQLVRVIAELRRANGVTADSAGNVYAAGAVFGARDHQHVVGYDPEGEMLLDISMNDIKGVLILED